MRDTRQRLRKGALFKRRAFVELHTIDSRDSDIVRHRPLKSHDAVLAIILALVRVVGRTVSAQRLAAVAQAVVALVDQNAIARFQVLDLATNLENLAAELMAQNQRLDGKRN